MNWYRSSIDAHGVKTVFPPQPKEWDDIPQCSFCQARTQFLHFYSVVLQYLDDDALVPSFCDIRCARGLIERLENERNNEL